jgi:hypothetical protein
MAEVAERIEDNAETACERSDWRVGAIGLVLLGTFVFLVISPLVLMAAFPRAVSDIGRELTITPPEPRLQLDPREDLAQFRAEEDKRLNNYYWVEKEKGIVHIPISQAMKEIAEKGIDGFPRGQP